MPVVVITPPEPIISLEEARAFLRVDDDGEQDTVIESVIAAAQSHIDGPEGWLGRAIGEQTLELRTALPHWRDLSCYQASWPRGIRLPYPPILSVEAVTYIDTDGDTQTVSADSYRLDGEAVRLADGFSWPSMLADETAIRVRYKAGYGATGGPKLPAAIRHAMLLLIGHWFENRQAVATGISVAEMPVGVAALLGPHRVWAA